MLAFYLALIDDPSDKEKFTDIYNRYKDKMFYKAKSIVHRDELAEDVVQESLLKIAKNIANVGSSESGSTAAFVIIITRNTAYDMLYSRALKFSYDSFSLPAGIVGYMEIFIAHQYKNGAQTAGRGAGRTDCGHIQGHVKGRSFRRRI